MQTTTTNEFPVNDNFHETGEESGILEIQTLAAAYAAEADAAAASLRFTVAALEQQVLLPAAPARKRPGRSQRLLVGLAGVCGVLAIGVGVLGIVALRGGVGRADTPEVAIDAPISRDVSAALEDNAAWREAARLIALDTQKDVVEVPAGGETALATAPDPDLASEPEPEPAPVNPAPTIKPKPSARPAPAPAPKPKPAPAARGEVDEVACLVDDSLPGCDALVSKPAPAPVIDAPAPDLPERPSRTNVKNAMSSVANRVASCGDRHDFSGLVRIRAVVDSTGRVTSATADAGSAAFQSCAIDAAGGARFEASVSGVTVTFPYTVR
jgi:hypothetical protein